MTHNFSTRHGCINGTDDTVFDIPGLGLTMLESWLGKTFMLPDSRVGECVSVRSVMKTDCGVASPSVDLGLRVDDGSLIFAPINSLKQIRKSA